MEITLSKLELSLILKALAYFEDHFESEYDQDLLDEINEKLAEAEADS